MTLIFNFVKLLRPLNILIAFCSILIATDLLDGFNNFKIFLYQVGVVCFFTAGANALNDAIDYKTDLINCPKRPIASGALSRDLAIFISFICFAIGMLFCLQLNDDAKRIGIIISMPLMIVYSTHLKGRALIGNIVVAIILGLSFLFCGAVYQNYNPMWVPSLLAFGLTFLRELIKDIADINGDLSAGLATYPIVAGIKKAINLAFYLSFSVGFFALIPYLIGIYNIWYLGILLIGVEVPLIALVVLIKKKPEISSAKKANIMLKFSTIMGLIAIYFGSY